MPKKIIITITVILLMLAAAGGLVFFVYGKIQTAEKNKPEDKPSITTLATLPAKNEEPLPEEESFGNETGDEENTKNTEENSEEVKTEETAPASDTESTANVVVLNGGAAVGSAGKIEKLLEDGGYKNTTATNALDSNHIGQMIYYKPAAKADAEAIQKLLKETYPEIEIKEGKTVEQTKTEIVIMLGE